MRLSTLKPGDRIEADVKGRRFVAIVKGFARGGVSVDAPEGITWTFLTARRVVRKVDG